MFPTGALQAVTPESINQAVDLFEIIKQLRLRLTSINEETLDRSFETHIQNVLEKLEKRLPFLSDNEAKNVEIVMAKHGLCDASFQQIILLCQQISPSLGDVLKQLRNIHSEFFSELQSISNQYLDRFNEQQKISNEMNQKIQNLEQECDELLAATKILDQEAEENNQLILDLRKQLRESLAEVNTARSSNGGRKTTVAAWKSQSASSTSASVTAPSFDTSLQADVRGRKLFDNMKRSDPHSSASLSPAAAAAALLSSSSSPSSFSASASASSGLTPQSSLTSLSQWLLSMRKEIQIAMDSHSIRSLSLNECRDLISSIFDSREQSLQKIKSKVQSTQQEMELHGSSSVFHSNSLSHTASISKLSSSHLSALCPDTLEVFVYQLMEKKYGLRSLAVEHSAMLLSAVERYRQQSSDITIRLFDFMFRNVIEEEYRGVIEELKKSVKDLLTVGMMNKFPHKDQATIEALVSEKMSSEETEESEWTSIVSYLYHSKDATTLRLLLRQEVNRLRQERGEAALPLSTTPSRTAPSSSSSPSFGRSHTPNKQRRPSLGTHKSTPQQSQQSQQGFTLPFSVFLSCILDFQISNHVKYLEGFHHIFQSCDADRDGLLSSEELVDCFHLLRRGEGRGGGTGEIGGAEEREMLEMVKKLLDPIGTGRVSYTVMASCMNQIGKKIMSKGSTNATATSGATTPKAVTSHRSK